MLLIFFFFNDTAPTEIYTLPLHDALPIPPLPAEALHFRDRHARHADIGQRGAHVVELERLDDRCDQSHETLRGAGVRRDRKSTRLNSSHSQISYAVLCLKKKSKHLTNSVD